TDVRTRERPRAARHAIPASANNGSAVYHAVADRIHRADCVSVCGVAVVELLPLRPTRAARSGRRRTFRAAGRRADARRSVRPGALEHAVLRAAFRSALNRPRDRAGCPAVTPAARPSDLSDDHLFAERSAGRGGFRSLALATRSARWGRQLRARTVRSGAPPLVPGQRRVSILPAFRLQGRSDSDGPLGHRQLDGDLSRGYRGYSRRDVR